MADNRLLSARSPIDEFRERANLDDLYTAARLKYPETIDDEVERLAQQRALANLPMSDGPGTLDEWRRYYRNVVPADRAAKAEQQQFDATRTPLNRLLSADAFIASAPVRMLTGGQYGAGDVMEKMPALRGLAPYVSRGEQDFARANEYALETVAQAGESAMALPGLQELGAIEGGLMGSLKAMRNTRAANAVNRLLPTAEDASRTMNIFAGPKAATADHAALAAAEGMEKAGASADEFNNWFSGSKVTDGFGKPLVMYRGTPDGSLGSHVQNGMVFVTPEREFANKYAGGRENNVHELYVNAKNPFDASRGDGVSLWREFSNENPVYPLGRTPRGALPFWTSERDLRKWLDERGIDYDGIYFSENDGSYSLAVPDVSQLRPTSPKNALAGKPGIRAYHGSPHDFDRFDMSKVGTGEGNQSFGHGLYFAGNEDVARSYKSAGIPTWKGTVVSQEVRSAINEANGDLDVAKALLIQKAKNALSATESQKFYDAYNNFDDARDVGVGHMYEVNIAADPDHFLDWDQSLGGQSEYVTNRLASIDDMYHPGSDDYRASEPGKFVYLRLQDSGKLRGAGIKGIKYFDQGSRGDGKGSRNYVVFDDSLISIVRKYGIPAAIGMGAITAEQGAQLQEMGF